MEQVIPNLLPELVDGCIFTDYDLMTITESNNYDINVYSDQYYDSHNVEYVDVEEIEEEEGVDGMTLRRVCSYSIDQVS
jgi:hypothetical protein